MNPNPPCKASEIAIRSSVTVSMGELKNGVLSTIFRVTLDGASQSLVASEMILETAYLVCKETAEAGNEI